MQVLQANVQRGSRVYERGHLLVLAWADAQRDQEVIWKILSQVRGCCTWTGRRRALATTESLADCQRRQSGRLAAFLPMWVLLFLRCFPFRYSFCFRSVHGCCLQWSFYVVGTYACRAY